MKFAPLARRMLPFFVVCCALPLIAACTTSAEPQYQYPIGQGTMWRSPNGTMVMAPGNYYGSTPYQTYQTTTPN